MQKVKEWIKSGKYSTSLAHFSPVSLPLDPSHTVVGIKRTTCLFAQFLIPFTAHVYIFKSAMHPLRIDFIEENGSVYSSIWKLGDDLRQDQLILRAFELMDSILKQENLDLKLRPYHVLATSKDSGLLQMVTESTNIADCIKDNGIYIYIPSVIYYSFFNKGDDAFALLRFLRNNNPSEDAPYGVDPTAMDNYVKVANSLLLFISFYFRVVLVIVSLHFFWELETVIWIIYSSQRMVVSFTSILGSFWDTIQNLVHQR